MFEHVFAGLIKTGWVLIPLVLASVAGWALVFERVFSLRRLEKTVGAETLQAVNRARAGGRAAMEAELDEVMKFRVPDLERFLSTLAILASAAPLMGLLGTVSGMVRTFEVISVFGTGNQALMSDSISESLLATQNGLLVAFPLMLMHIRLTSRAEAIERNALAAAVAMMNRLAGPEHRFAGGKA
jgi:biopolymer transport protein ExbB